MYLIKVHFIDYLVMKYCRTATKCEAKLLRDGDFCLKCEAKLLQGQGLAKIFRT